ncbi:putative F-box protein [Hibiscus syriacus]|uniref:F-box protein n=1 Tax=Hibiscus syriacus TaxID=106335 RepID=A0A6A3AWY1_HIBSY|nr:probable F-box protein At4g22030 [Hibiscus syriacus]KAE8709111.1 putative F-box protein [Hibiscus syriacus]
MASLQASNFFLSSSSNKIHAAISVPKLPLIRLSAPKLQPKITGDGFIKTIPIDRKVNETPLLQESSSLSNSMATLQQLYAISEAVADRVETHQNVGEQRDNWNTLLLNSINMMTLTATTMAGVASATGGDGGSGVGLKLASTVLFLSATGMLVLMNTIQPSQLVEEQRNATRLFKQLENQIKTLVAVGSPTQEDVNDAMEKVLALDKAYPLPLLGVMLEKFPETFQPAVWWPRNKSKRGNGEMKSNNNGWTKELEMEMKEVVEVIKKKDGEDYDRLGNKALKINKVLAKSGPLLTGFASALMVCSNNPWAATMAAVTGALASTVNTLEHGGQVGMVFEMYRNNAGFFKLVQELIESTLDESDLERRENGELFEMKVALQLGRSLSELRDLAKKSRYSRVEGSPIDEFASKLF